LVVSSIGFLVPEAPWSARIALVASKAVVLIHEDGAALSIVGTLANMDARACALECGFKQFSASAADALAASRPGSEASVINDGTTLRISETERGAALLEGAALWDPRRELASSARSGGISCLDQTLEYIEEELESAREAGRAREGIHGDGPFARAFLRLRDVQAFPANLVGFGPGSTPAGDDWLAGYLAARDLMEGGPCSAEHELRNAVERALHRTTPAGRALLLGTLAGAPPAYIVELVLASTPAMNRKSNVRKAVQAALGHGSTSGEDALTGFVTALKLSRTKPRCGMIETV